jgi:hypothetical protein
MLSAKQWGGQSNQGDGSDELCLRDDQLMLSLVRGIKLGQGERNVECRPAAEHADAMLA